MMLMHKQKQSLRRGFWGGPGPDAIQRQLQGQLQLAEHFHFHDDRADYLEVAASPQVCHTAVVLRPTVRESETSRSQTSPLYHQYHLSLRFFAIDLGDKAMEYSQRQQVKLKWWQVGYQIGSDKNGGAGRDVETVKLKSLAWT